MSSASCTSAHKSIEPPSETYDLFKFFAELRFLRFSQVFHYLPMEDLMRLRQVSRGILALVDEYMHSEIFPSIILTAVTKTRDYGRLEDLSDMFTSASVLKHTAEERIIFQPRNPPSRFDPRKASPPEIIIRSSDKSLRKTWGVPLMNPHKASLYEVFDFRTRREPPIAGRDEVYEVFVAGMESAGAIKVVYRLCDSDRRRVSLEEVSIPVGIFRRMVTLPPPPMCRLSTREPSRREQLKQQRKRGERLEFPLPPDLLGPKVAQATPQDNIVSKLCLRQAEFSIRKLNYWDKQILDILAPVTMDGIIEALTGFDVLPVGETIPSGIPLNFFTGKRETIWLEIPGYYNIESLAHSIEKLSALVYPCPLIVQTRHPTCQLILAYDVATDKEPVMFLATDTAAKDARQPRKPTNSLSESSQIVSPEANAGGLVERDPGDNVPPTSSGSDSGESFSQPDPSIRQPGLMDPEQRGRGLPNRSRQTGGQKLPKLPSSGPPPSIGATERSFPHVAILITEDKEGISQITQLEFDLEVETTRTCAQAATSVKMHSPGLALEFPSAHDEIHPPQLLPACITIKIGTSNPRDNLITTNQIRPPYSFVNNMPTPTRDSTLNIPTGPDVSKSSETTEWDLQAVTFRPAVHLIGKSPVGCFWEYRLTSDIKLAANVRLAMHGCEVLYPLQSEKPDHITAFLETILERNGPARLSRLICTSDKQTELYIGYKHLIMILQVRVGVRYPGDLLQLRGPDRQGSAVRMLKRFSLATRGQQDIPSAKTSKATQQTASTPSTTSNTTK